MTADDGADSSPPKEVKPILPPATEDSVANKEEKVFEVGDSYEKEFKIRDYLRAENLRNILHWLVVGGVVITGLLLISGIVIWALHVLLPVHWHWLTPEQISEIQKIMSSALLAMVISDYSKKYLMK